MPPDPTQGAGACTTRSVSQSERALLAQWFAGADRTGPAAVAAAYVSERSHDDPRLRNMIVIAARVKTNVSYLIHRPLGESGWILTNAHTDEEIGRFPTLPEALNVFCPYRAATSLLSAPVVEAMAEKFATASN